MNFRKTLSDWLVHRYRLVMRDEENLEEKSTFRFSYAKLIIFGAALFAILAMCSLALTTTLLARWLHPTYTEQENKKTIIQLSVAVDALEKQTIQQKKFIARLQSIIEGKEVPADDLPTTSEQPVETAYSPYTPEHLAAADALLRHEFENSESSLLTTYNKPKQNLKAHFLLPPINGIVTTPCKHSIGHYGVDIVTREKEPIKCIADGVVIFSSWTVETGWVMVVQHNGDLVSTYKHNAALLKKVGNFVEAGEVIAIVGNSGELSTGPHLHFELWHAGSALNPEDFITF